MVNFNTGSITLVANTLRTSPGVAAAQNFTTCTVTLVDTNAEWPAVEDTTRFIKIFGVQQSDDNGATWRWGPTWIGNPQGSTADVDRFGPGGVDYWMPFGHRNRSGGMPNVSFSSSQLIGSGAVQLRLAIESTAALRIGANILTA